MDKKFISSRQYMVLVILYSIGTTILFIPSSMATYAKQDGWIAPLLSLIVGLSLIWLFIKVGKLNPDKSLVESAEIILGKWLGIFFGFYFFLFCFVTGAQILWYVGYFINTQFMGQTPMWFTHVIFTFVIVYAVRGGIEVIVRTGEILFVFVIVILCFFTLFISPSAKIENIQPLFEADIQSISTATFSCLSIIGFPSVVFLNVFPINIKDVKKSKTTFFLGYSIGAFVVFLITLITIMVLGSTISGNMLFSSFWLTKKIHLFQGLERFEIILAFAWLITTFYKILLYFYGAVIGLSNILKLKDYRFTTLPLGIIFIVFSLIVYPNIVESSAWDAKIWPAVSLTFGLFFPLLLLIVGSIKNKLKNSKAKASTDSGSNKITKNSDGNKPSE